MAMQPRNAHVVGMSELHVVLGAGQVGPRVARTLAERGHRVRVVRRGSGGLPGVEVVSLDLRDADAVARATEGATSVYHCANPLYSQWNELLLPMTRGIVSGVSRSGARLVALDNLYMYGDTSRMAPDSKPSPRSVKGRLRVEAAELMLGIGARIGRAADFFGPDTPLGSVFGERFYRRILSGKSGECFGDADQPHAYSYTPDVAAGLVALGTSRSAQGIYMLPTLPAEPTRAVIGRFYRELGKDLGVSAIPTWVLRAMGLFQPVVRELVEMVYQWEQPFVVDDSRAREELGLQPTPWDEAVPATLAWAKRAYARA